MVNKILPYYIVCVWCLVCAVNAPSLFADQQNHIILIDDFNDKTRPNALGGPTLGDEESIGGCIPSFTESPDDSFGRQGHSLRLDYDVTTEGMFSFYVSHLQSVNQEDGTIRTLLDVSPYNYLSFWARAAQYPVRFAVELQQDVDGDGTFILSRDVSHKVNIRLSPQKNDRAWQKVIIPLKQFRKITDWSSIIGVVFVFDSSMHSGSGTLFIDDLLVGSGYPRDKEEQEKQQAAFKTNVSLSMFMINKESVSSGVSVMRNNRAQLLVRNNVSTLESVSIDVQYQQAYRWSRIITFYGHHSNLYERPLIFAPTVKPQIISMRVSAVDVWGNEKVIGGPYQCRFEE